MCNCPEYGSNKTPKHKNSNIVSAACLAGVLLMLVFNFSGCKPVQVYEQVSAAKIEEVQEETKKSEPEEKELFDFLRSGNYRLEQEKIPFEYLSPIITYFDKTK